MVGAEGADVAAIESVHLFPQEVVSVSLGRRNKAQADGQVGYGVRE